MVAVLVRDAVTSRSHVERFVEQHALKNVHNVSKNVSVRLSGTDTCQRTFRHTV